MPTKKYFIITFGCQMNRSDSERISAVLESIGYKPAQEADFVRRSPAKGGTKADLIVVNACSVRQSAIDRIWGQAAKFAKLKTLRQAQGKPQLKTILTGCVLKEDKKKLSKVFDLIMDIKDLPKLPELLGIKKEEVASEYLEIIPNYQSPFSAFVPIMTGCNNFCAFCAVPYTRGREISRPAKDIICEIKNLINRGYKEIWLLGQNVNSYYSPIRANKRIINFPKLLSMINTIPGNFWIRFTSPHPKPSTRAKLGTGQVPHRNKVSGAGDFSDELIETMAECEKITPYLNLPVQSGDNGILRKMNRPYTVAHYKNLVKKIRKKIPDICLSTDVIVGFPGETKKQFENTAKLFREIKYDMAYISQYSPRPGTIAVKLKDNVPKSEKEKRSRELNGVLAKTALENNKKFIGKIVDVLTEKRKDKFLIGKSRHYKTVKFESNKNLIGKFVKIKIAEALPWGLTGKI